MLKRILSLIMMFFAISMWSQEELQNDYSVFINGNKIPTSANFKEQVREFKKNTSKQKPVATYYLVQFTQMPSVKEQQKLKEQGITLLSYLSNNAYYALINSNYYNKGVISSTIRTVVTVDSKYKIDPMIANGAIPDYALEGSNNVKVVVSYFKGVDSKVISQNLAGLFVKSSKIDESFNEVYLEASRDKLEEIAKLNWVQNIELVAAPVESDNKPGVTSHKVNVLSSVIPGLGYGLTGKGVKVGVWDGNLEKHKDHTGRVTIREYESNSSHGEHVSGTIGGAGLLDPRARGMAPEVEMFGWNFNTQSNGLSVQQERVKAVTEDGIEITSNSYGSSLTSGYNVRRYDNADRGDDNVTVLYPYLLNVYSNGNSQSAYPGGFNTSTKNSKNSLHVAANNPDDMISGYSSFGPTIDGRLVPQIAAVGSDVYSLAYSNGYQVMSGTSMATPGTSGTIALLYERYKNIYGEKPLASLMKALVTNTAIDAGNPGPDYKYGFGNLNGLRAIKALDKKMFYTATVAGGAVYEKEIVVPVGLVSLKVMLAYSDVAGTPGSTSVQVNDLDIKIVKDGTTTLPWILNPTTPNANATRGVDTMNNIEQVTLDNPAPGTYKIVVTGTRVPLNSQEFSVVYDYVAPELSLTYPIGREKFNPETTEYIRWDYEGEAKTFTIEYSLDGGINYTTLAKEVPAAARSFAWKVPAAVVANAKIRISTGAKVDTSKEVFNIIAEPKNLVIAPAVCGTSSYKMDWDPIAGAKYEVLKMNGYKFDVVATVTEPSYTFNNLTAGEDNWFSVRTIDVATGITSERVKAINVDPVSQPVLTVASLPFLENFNERKATNYVLSKGTAGIIKYEYVNATLLDGVKMAGSGNVSLTPWVASTTANAFANNPNFIKKMSFCDVDATALTGKVIRMKFNLIWNSVGAVNKNFFRVLVNGIPLSSHENIDVYAGATLSGNTEVIYDLSAFAGTTFSIAFEAVMDNDASVVGNDTVYTTVFVDNVSLFEATTTDLALSSLVANTALTATETVTMKVFNNSPVAISTIPVSYKINEETEVSEVIPGPIAPLSSVSYDFVQKVNYATPGVYKVVGNVNYTGDAVVENNTITKTVYNNGTDVLMGSATPNTTCSAVFTDNGTRFTNYSDNVTQTLTFKPATAGSSIKVDFTTFDTEQDFDYLYVYNGPSVSAASLVGTFTGNALPSSITSKAAGGELTFRFTSDSNTNGAGWTADISCVAKPTVLDASVAAIVTPEILGKKTSTNDVTIRVSNLGATALTNHPVYYQVNGGAKVAETVPAIAAYATVSFTFAAKADLSDVGATYLIKSGVDITDDNNSNDAKEKTVYNKNELPVHENTSGYAISKLKWNDVVNTSGTTAYSDFKNIKIPVYPGLTYQPEVSITKIEIPITRDLSATAVGVFTMMVIDLNGDGNLTDEFYAGNFWVNTTPTSAAPAIPSTTSTHYFRNNISLAGGLTIPAGTTAGEKLMRVIHMFRSPNEYFNVNLGPTIDGLTSSRGDFEIEEYTVNVLPLTAADASVERITAPFKSANKPVTVTAVIRNFSNTVIANFPIAYKINGGTEVVQNVSTSIAALGTATFSFTTKADLSASGDYTIEVYTKLAGDTDVTNDSKSISLTHAANYALNVVGTFDGVDDFIKTDVTPALDLTNNYTFEAWVNQKKPSTFGRVLDKSRALVFIHNSNNVTLYKENSLVISITTASGSYVINTGANSIKQNIWQHIAYTVSSTNVYTVYIDGVSVPFTSTGIAGAATTNATLPAYIGNNATLTRGLNGNIDEVRIWSGVRDQATISGNAMVRYTGNEAGLTGYYPFSEGDKQFVHDSSANDNTAVVTNADSNGLGEGKFWNIPVLLQKVDFVNQLSSTYDAATKTYTVLLNNGSDITTAVANWGLGMNSIAKINGITQVNGITANDYTNPVTLTVEGVGFNTGISETYTIKVITDLKTESKLISYNFTTASNPVLTSDINTDITGNNVTKTVVFGTNISSLKADFVVSPGAELYIDGVKQLNSKTIISDYSNSFLVTVVSENKLSQTNYTVTLNARNSEANILAYTVANQVGTSVIDPVSKTAKVLVDNNADLATVVPVFQISDFATLRIGTYFQDSGVTRLNYTSPVVYNVLAQNGDIVDWTVTIERAAPIITLLGDAIVSINKGCVFTDAGYSAKDNLGVDIGAGVVVSGSVDVNTPGQYIRTYTVKDALQNQTSVTRIINVSSTACSLGVDSNTIEGFVIYPNPVKDGKVHIQTSSGSSKNIRISDMSGKKVFTIRSADKEINVSSLPSGVYIVKVEQDGKTATQKLIIK
ncbi:S8 family serine peptidase [Flavobacterium sp. Fl-318]|uniref:S8 family serine peptidase n=1 Tax=Flavobacterium cupriresistens TaxID=2893885 RepID=A0ABU4RDD2_9FLAO|nr:MULTISPECIES: S8 family serine peptidase [unclassified Flavobacterium]MDX6189435.1 S8 family serine peptidase [Flavobacterium sp. Fl-318]UFH41155.1 S8 family serine peptidase [Flavobacterium sp. F-323]